MKKIILIILTALVSLFIFNYNVEALNSDATATCVYTIPSNKLFTSATFKYENVDLSKSCSIPTSTSASIFECKIDAEITKDYFVDGETDKVYCPNLYYFYQVIPGVSLGGTASPTTYSFQISYKEIKTSFINDLLSVSSKGQMKLASSKINQGSTEIKEDNESDYLQCICGSILLKQGSITFNSIYDSYKKNYNWVSFNLNYFSKCPEAIYYKENYAMNLNNKTIDISDAQFEKSQSAACATTEDAAGWNGSSGNDTDYKPQEDVIKSFCEETNGVWRMAGYLINALKVMIPAIIIVMGSIDLGKAVVANSEDEMKKATQVLIKRIIAGIVIFFIPTIINLVLNMASNYVSTISSGSGCIECVSKPWAC